MLYHFLPMPLLMLINRGKTEKLELKPHIPLHVSSFSIWNTVTKHAKGQLYTLLDKNFKERYFETIYMARHAFISEPTTALRPSIITVKHSIFIVIQYIGQ